FLLSRKPTLMTSLPFPPVTPATTSTSDTTVATLVLKDGTSYQGFSFGAETHSVAGECVFQTGMVGYPESLTDPSYHGQILVLTFPLIGNYGVPSRDDMDPILKDIPRYFESSNIHVAALVVGQYSSYYSHYLAHSSLGDWLKTNDIPAIYGVDTRALTKKIRINGVMLGKILFPKESVTGSPSSSVNKVHVDGFMKLTSISAESSLMDHIEDELVISSTWMDKYQDADWVDPNEKNLVAEVSIKTPKLYTPDPKKAIKGANSKTLKILALDVGMKYNQIRCFINRGVELKIVPWNYDFLNETDYDGLFIRHL
ncbi:12916_t:CDS:2, partial [Ambispora leptoticha]